MNDPIFDYAREHGLKFVAIEVHDPDGTHQRFAGCVYDGSLSDVAAAIQSMQEKFIPLSMV